MHLSLYKTESGLNKKKIPENEDENEKYKYECCKNKMAEAFNICHLPS